MKLRQTALLDPLDDLWDANFRKDIDALIIIADNNPEVLNRKSLEIVRSLEDITTNIFNEQGDTLRKDFNSNKSMVVEHFGYADGISQPIFLKKKNVTSGGGFSSDAPLSLVLVTDPFGTSGVSFGSFLVFRKLEQNVQGFKKAEAALSKALGIPFELAGAMAVGRFEDGTPLVLQPNDGSPGLNSFDYKGDTQGLRCPFQAHIRKSNPRLESVGTFADSEEQELGHRIARRGVTYGGPLSDFSQDLERLPTSGVGLLFMCYQSDIWEQFEFIQRFWCNNPFFLKPDMNENTNPNYDRTGLDAVIGQKQGVQVDPLIKVAPEPPKNWPKSYGQPTVKPDIAPDNEFGQFVTLKGGEYFFSPSLTFLKSLSNQPSTGETEQPTLGAFYVVKSSDFLFNIAERAYGDGNLFAVIYEANKDVIGDDPNAIINGQRLFIPR